MPTETNKLSSLLETAKSERAQKDALQELVTLWLAYAFVLACLSFMTGAFYGMYSEAGSSFTDLLVGSKGSSSLVISGILGVVVGGYFLYRKTMTLHGPQPPSD